MAKIPVLNKEKNFSLLRSETKTVVKEFALEADARAHQDKVDPYGIFTVIQPNR